MPNEINVPDKLNRRILHQLDQNSRRPVNDIARVLRMSEETLRYRLQRIEASGWLFKYHSIVDTARLGYSLYKVYIRLQSASEAVTKKIVSFLTQTKEVVSLIGTDGNYDFVIGVLLSRVNELDEFIDRLMQGFHPYIAHRSICVNIRSDYLAREYLITDKPRKNVAIRSYQATADEIARDPVDLLILRELGRSSRSNAADIARAIAARNLPRSLLTNEISRETVLYRIKKLEKSRIINGYNIVLNHRAMNQLQYKILVHLNYAQSDELKDFLKSLTAEPRVVYIIKTLGEWDYEIELEVESIEECKALLMRVTEKHPGIIKNYSALHLSKIYLYDTGRRLDKDLAL